MKILVLLFTLNLSLFAYEIIQTPIQFDEKRIQLTKDYIKNHYGLNVKNIKIIPKIVLIHYTAIKTYETSVERFTRSTLPNDRPEISKASALNVSTHFMVERDGTIHQLMPLDFMARHVIGLNYNSIGIENVGGVGYKEDLTVNQLLANIFLVKYLQKKFPTIEYVVGHHEYRCFEDTELWLEKDDGYRTEKFDPGSEFMRDLRFNISGFKAAPCD
ncbi:MAG: peptidoglycan recognition family protein [Sulfurimonas sp.]|nr:peptidoglycan recognition family protein [Sulfurimonas sp.]MDQ7060991.1 peptidoglycan recognition family protein [Sulfurimonas sp.]